MALVATEIVLRFLAMDGRLSGMALTGVARLLESILMILIVLRFGKGLQDIGLHRLTMGRGLKQGIAWSAGFGALTAIAAAVMIGAGLDPFAYIAVAMPPDSADIILLFCTAGVVGPVAEEIFFRGLMYGFFRRWGIVPALFLTTVVFVLAHSVTHPIPLPQIVGGFVFALAYEVSGSLITPIVIHILGNSAIYALSLLFS